MTNRLSAAAAPQHGWSGRSGGERAPPLVCEPAEDCGAEAAWAREGRLGSERAVRRGKGGPVCATLALCPWPGVPGGGAEAAWEGGLESERAGRRGRCWSAGRLAPHGCAPAGAPLDRKSVV